MSKFIATSRSKPCPSCGDEAGRCRHQAEGDIILCMSANSGRKGELVDGGYKIIGFSQDGLWAILKPDNSQEWTDERRREWASEQKRRREQAQVEEQRRLSKLLPTANRDKQYRRIVATLGLNHKHSTELSSRRGLNPDEIDFALTQQWLCSWKPGVKVNASSSLAGVAGGQLTGVVGLGIAALNVEGEITGFQIASDNRAKFGKYIWLSSASKGGLGPHLPSGELPIFVWKHPQATEITESWLVEGGLKSLLTALKLWFRCGRKDIQVIGAAGGNWHGSINAVAEALNQVNKVVLCADAGSVNNAHILANYKKTIEELTNKTYSVSVAWWGQLEKEKDADIDELENTLEFDLITPGEFFLLAKDSSFIDETNNWAWRNWLRNRRYTSDIVINQPKFSFGQIPDKGVIIAGKSGLGSHKTEALLKLIRLSEVRSFLIGYRNNLLFQTGNRGDQIGIKIYHLRQDEGLALVADDNTHLALCLDSIHHVDGYFNDVDIYLDETVSVLIHATDGGTLKEGQGKALAILTKALRECRRIILLDANLADIFVDFIAKISRKKVIKIENQAKIPPHNFKFVTGVDEFGDTKQLDKSPLIKAMISPGEIPWIASDSKSLTDRLDAILKEQGRLNGYVLNKDTSGEEWAKEFLLDPDIFILKYMPDYFIISPTAESGVSVTIQNYFTAKYTFFTGVQGTNSQHQMLFRLRNNSITHYVFCPERSTITDRNSPRTYADKKFAEILADKALLSATLASEGTESGSMLEVVGKAISRSNDDWFQLSCKLGAIDNFEMDNLRKCLIYVLEEAGHDVEICEWETCKKTQKLEEAAKEAVLMRHALELYQASEFESLEEANKVAKGNPKKEVQRRIEKTRLLDRLPGIKESGVWDVNFIADYYLKDREFISKQQRFYFLNNFEISQKRSEVNWYYLATDQDFFLGQAKRDSHLKVWALQQLNVLQFMNGEFYKDSAQVIELVDKVRNDKTLQLALGTKPNPPTQSGKERIAFIKVLLDSIGVKVGKPVQKIIDGVKHRVYSVKSSALNSPVRLAVLAAIALKFDNYLESETVKKVCWDEQPVIEAVELVDVEEVTDIEPGAMPHDLTQSVYAKTEILPIEMSATPTVQDMRIASASDESLVSSHQSPVEARWLEDESINYVAELLRDCEDPEMLRDIRAIAPVAALKMASRKLSPDKRSKIRQWVQVT